MAPANRWPASASGNAAMLARGGELDGVRVMEAETIRTALTEQSHLEVDLSLRTP